jgi:hypothetical protein
MVGDDEITSKFLVEVLELRFDANNFASDPSIAT